MRSRTTQVAALALISIAIALVIVFQDWGRVLADTKLDLIVEPGRFLRRAISLWDPLGERGRLQNQAYGYLFPMGPFFVLSDRLGVEPWIAQRIWEAAIVIAGFLGMHALARSLGVARFWAAALSGLAHAAAPRVLAEVT